MIKTIKPSKLKTYVGYTDNISKRLEKHNSGKGAKSTRGYQWRLIYKRYFNDKFKAMSYEYKLKNNRKKRYALLNK
tara:strand:+ start:48 stop:275 length:228 start_codon:yes stop_codon:yes gene_type:complete